jgi:hypothetical protein
MEVLRHNMCEDRMITDCPSIPVKVTSSYEICKEEKVTAGRRACQDTKKIWRWDTRLITHNVMEDVLRLCSSMLHCETFHRVHKTRHFTLVIKRCGTTWMAAVIQLPHFYKHLTQSFWRGWFEMCLKGGIAIIVHTYCNWYLPRV